MRISECLPEDSVEREIDDGKWAVAHKGRERACSKNSVVIRSGVRWMVSFHIGARK